MSESHVLAGSAASAGEHSRQRGKSLIIHIAWRNLWRNRKRTWFTAGGIIFAVLLLVFSMSLQVGSYAVMIENASALLESHIQVQHSGYRDDPTVRRTVEQAKETAHRIEQLSGVVQVGLRSAAFALVSAGEKTFGAQVMGVEPEAELILSTLPQLIKHGHYLNGPNDAYLGSALARNLGVDLGDEVVVLGSGKEGGVAALVLAVAGIYESGQPELDRALLQVPLAAFQDAFGLSDEVHEIVVKTAGAYEAPAVAERIQANLENEPGSEKLVVLTWNELIPELEQAIELDRTSGRFMYFLLGLMVVFSVVNTFVMTIFERTREFGMLLALGMRPRSIIGMLQLEALSYCFLGISIGLVLATLLVWYLGNIGIPMGDSVEMLRKFHMPDRLYPALSLHSATTAPLVMLLSTQLAALLPSLRVMRMKPILALKAE